MSSAHLVFALIQISQARPSSVHDFSFVANRVVVDRATLFFDNLVLVNGRSALWMRMKALSIMLGTGSFVCTSVCLPACLFAFLSCACVYLCLSASASVCVFAGGVSGCVSGGVAERVGRSGGERARRGGGVCVGVCE